MSTPFSCSTEKFDKSYGQHFAKVYGSVLELKALCAILSCIRSLCHDLVCIFCCTIRLGNLFSLILCVCVCTRAIALSKTQKTLTYTSKFLLCLTHEAKHSKWRTFYVKDTCTWRLCTLALLKWAELRWAALSSAYPPSPLPVQFTTWPAQMSRGSPRSSP